MAHQELEHHVQSVVGVGASDDADLRIGDGGPDGQLRYGGEEGEEEEAEQQQPALLQPTVYSASVYTVKQYITFQIYNYLCTLLRQKK